MQSLTGIFPFGRPSVRCEPRRVSGAQALVLGVYPSALHIRWRHPRQRIAALAVAREPWPFWAGEDEAERVDRWRHDVGWRPEWGTAEPAGHVNGYSGRVVRERVLRPLGIEPDQVWMTDVLPFFHVHRTARGQGEAMSTRYDPVARTHGLPVHRLPRRPRADQLVRRAVDDEATRIRDEVIESSTPLLITLGNEALAVAAQVLGGDLPDRLTADGEYGRRHRATVNGKSVEVLPLVHPGQRGTHWRQTHDQWVERPAG